MSGSGQRMFEFIFMLPGFDFSTFLDPRPYYALFQQVSLRNKDFIQVSLCQFTTSLLFNCFLDRDYTRAAMGLMMQHRTAIPTRNRPVLDPKRSVFTLCRPINLCCAPVELLPPRWEGGCDWFIQLTSMR